jgi:hypothetical protein
MQVEGGRAAGGGGLRHRAGYSSASLQVYDFVPYAPAVNTTWWGAGLVDWTVPVGCSFFGCTNTLENLCSAAKATWAALTSTASSARGRT